MTSLQRTAVKLSRLQTRLFARYQEVLSGFHDTVHEFNKRIDEMQTDQMVKLKEFLLESHSECENILQQEKNRVDSFKEHLTKQAAGAVALVDDVLPLFTDCYHNAEVRVEDSNVRMRADRKRIVALCVTAQSMYQKRISAIAKTEEEIETREKERQVHLSKLLTDFVEALTAIGYTSIVGSHVLAQRVIHTINKHLCTNHLGRKTLMAQLRSREILKQRQYSSRLTDVYGTSLELMISSGLQWATTLLQAAHFRRPQHRMDIIEQLRELIFRMKRDGSQFVSNMALIVQSLRRSRDPLPTECGQICGGTLPDGWLRGFDGGLFSPVFSVSPSEVTVEWRVKANVLVKNAMLECTTLMENVRLGEKHICAEAESILTGIHALVEWACKPEEAEVKMLTEASMNSGENWYPRFNVANTTLFMTFKAKTDESLRPLLAAIQRESEWFVKAVETQLLNQHTLMGELLLTGPKNVLLIFHKVTDALEVAVTNALGFVRARFVELYEARRDHEDALRHVEQELAQNEENLRRAATAEEAEKLFAEGLAIFERVASVHTEFHRNTVQSLQRIVQEARVEVERHCAVLLRFVGLEDEESCRRRLEEERRLEREASTKKSGRAKEVVVDSSSESDNSVTPPYPSITAANGQLYYIVGPILPEEPKKIDKVVISPSSSQQRSNRKGFADRLKSPAGKKTGAVAKQAPQRAGAGGKTPKESPLKSESSMNSHCSFPAVAEAPSHIFLSVYKNLLNGVVHGTPVDFLLSAESVTEWYEMLRLEVLHWSLRLCESSVEHAQQQCAVHKSAIDEETNEVLRHHRRRPAKLQCEIYEGRLRQIEDKQMNKEASRSRLKKQFLQFENAWSFTQSDECADNQEDKLFEQLKKMEKMAYEANSLNTLMSQERQLASLISSSIEERTNHWDKIMADMLKEKKSLELECRAHLLRCGKSVPVNLDDIQDFGYLSDSNDCKEVVDMLIRLRDVATAVREKVTAEREQYLQRIDAAKASYSAIYERSVGELQVLDRIQEVLSRLKVQVHSLTTVSSTTEANIEALLKDLEDKLAAPALFYNFADTLHEITHREYSATLSSAKNALPDKTGDSIIKTGLPLKSEAGEMTAAKDRVLEAERVLNQRLAELEVEIQRQVRSSDIAKVFFILDNLREALYTRGRYLNCLQYGVEFLSVPQDDFIEPRLGAVAEPSGGVENTRRPSSAFLPSQQTRQRRRSRCVTQNDAAGHVTPYSLLELPVVFSAEREVNDGIAAVKTQVADIIEQHCLLCPPPLMHRLPGMSGGDVADVMNMCHRVCDQQHQRALQHVAEATKRYRAQVQRVLEAVRQMPDYITNKIYTFSAIALERRVATVFDVFSAFYGEADALRLYYDRLLKVTLASNHNRNKLDVLCNAEDDRHVATSDAVEKFWGFALREMQDEASLHVAKSINVNNNFFALMRGIVLPENLKPAEDESGSGRHRGLRHLLRLKAADERTKELQAQQQVPKRERRLQETLPRHTRSGIAAGGKKNDLDADLSGGPLPLAPSHEVEHGRVPLRSFCPLEEFLVAHPTSSVSPPDQSLSQVFAHLLSTPFHSVATVTRRGKKKGSQIMLTSERVESVSIVAPATVLNKEIADRTRQSVERFKECSTQVVKETNEVFQKLAKNETDWRATWEASIQRLKA